MLRTRYNPGVLSGTRFIFEPFELDAARRTLSCAREKVAIADRPLDVLLVLVARAGEIVAKDDLLQAGWKDVAVGDNSLEQAVSSLRRLLAASAPGLQFIETVARRGYRFSAPVSRHAPRESDAALDALLEPHRAFVEGRAALETLERDQIMRAREVFEGAVRTVPELAPAHIGLANACVLQFEMTRADAAPNIEALALAARHAREACRLDPGSGEAWATLGFVLERTGGRVDALAASQRAASLEPDNWRHQLRLAYVGWGEQRLRAAHRALTLLPDFPLARWLAATVHVARQALPEAERELTAAIGVGDGMARDSRFTPIALHWLLGLVRLSQDDEAGALDEFQRELALSNSSHLYARECSANTHYAIGALMLRRHQPAEAAAAFERALRLVPGHPMARAGLAPTLAGGQPTTVDAALCQAARLTLAGRPDAAARLVEEMLGAAPPGSAGWHLPVEPLLRVAAHPGPWTRALDLVRNRAL